LLIVVAFALVLAVTCGLGLFSLQRLSTVDDREWVIAALLLATSLCVAA
jgi:hypothetical protein